MSQTYEHLAVSGLEQIGLKTAASQLDQVSQRAAAENWSYTHFLGYLLEGELAERQRKTVYCKINRHHPAKFLQSKCAQPESFSAMVWEDFSRITPDESRGGDDYFGTARNYPSPSFHRQIIQPGYRGQAGNFSTNRYEGPRP